MDEAKQRIKAIGKKLVDRRVSFDPANNRARPGWMETVKAHTDLSQSIITHIETGSRDSYASGTLAAIEELYRLRPGTLGPALKGEGQLISEDNELLYPLDPSEPFTPPPPDPVEEQLLRFSKALRRDVERLPDKEAAQIMARALAAAEVQAFLVIDMELRRQERQRMWK